MKRVVITGMGAITPIGKTHEEFWASLKEGRHGIAPISVFDTSDSPVKLAAEVKGFDPTLYIEKKETRRMDRFCQFAVGAALDALKDSKTKFEDLDPYLVGVIMGSGIGGLQTMEA